MLTLNIRWYGLLNATAPVSDAGLKIIIGGLTIAGQDLKFKRKLGHPALIVSVFEAG